MESLNELYEKFRKERINKIRELIEVQEQLNISDRVSNILERQSKLKSLFNDTDSAKEAVLLDERMQDNEEYLMKVMGVGVNDIQAVTESVTPIANEASQKSIGVVEAIDFEDFEE